MQVCNKCATLLLQLSSCQLYAVSVWGIKLTSDGILQVRMLGEFSMTWECKEICGGSKASDAQFTRLLQLLLHFRKEGIERTKLQSLLFDDSNSDDVHHLLRTVIYNTRKKLANSALPDATFIEFRDGRYYWTDAIPVEADTEKFEALCKAAAEEPDDDERLRKYMEAVSAYKGSFLPNQSRLAWVAAEESRYKTLFAKCVEEAAALLREKNDYDAIESLGYRASIVSPLNDWEFLMLESYVHTGRIREAQKLYENTFDLYQDKLGTLSLFDFTKQVDQFFEMSDSIYSDLNGIIGELRDDWKSGESAPGYYCAYPVFRGIYHIVRWRMSMPDYESDPYMFLCSVKKPRFRSSKEAELFEKNTDRARTAICEASSSDTAICRYCKGQFLGLILRGSEEVCKDLQKRIKSNFKREGGNGDVLSFEVKSLRQ